MQLPNGYRSVYSFPVTFIVKYLSGTERHARLSLPYQATLVSVLLSRTKVIYVRAASVYLSAPAPSSAKSSQTGSGGAHQPFPAGGKNWVPTLSQPALEGQSGAAKTFPQLQCRGRQQHGCRRQGCASNKRRPRAEGLKQSARCRTELLHRRRGPRHEFREGFAWQSEAGGGCRVPAAVSLGTCRKHWGMGGDLLNSFVPSWFLLFWTSEDLSNGGV